MSENGSIEGWAVVELLGYRRLTGRVREVEVLGARMLRIDVALPDGRSWPVFHAASALYSLTPTTAESISADDRRENQANLIGWELAPAAEREDYEAWRRAVDERRRIAWDQQRTALLTDRAREAAEEDEGWA